MSIRPNQYVGKLIGRWVVNWVRSRRLGQKKSNTFIEYLISNVDYLHSINLAYLTCGWALISIDVNRFGRLNTIGANGGGGPF